MGERIPDVAARRATRDPAVTWSEVAGRVHVVQRKFGAFGTGILKLAHVSPTFTVKLDELGSAVWLLCDGRTVAEIRAQLETRWPELDDVNRRLGAFLGTMVSKGFLHID